MPPPSEERRRKRHATRFETFRIQELRVPDVDPTGGAADFGEKELVDSPTERIPRSHVDRREHGFDAGAGGAQARSEVPTIPVPPDAVLTEYSVTERAPPPWRVLSEEDADTLTPEEWIDEDPSDV